MPIQSEFLNIKYTEDFDLLKIFEKLDQLSCDIITIMQNSPDITQAEICTAVKKSRVTVQRRIKVLIDSGIVKRKGSTRKGTWEIRKKI